MSQISQNKIQSIRGMNDILPEEIPFWQHLEKIFRRLTHNYAFKEIRTPIIEATELFVRSVGEGTDIVEKETYTFQDRDKLSMTLRPEGTASCVRAAIEHGLTYNQTQRLWYFGPFFRHERPQKGRFRQFYQYGVEIFGLTAPEAEIELLAMLWQLFQSLNLQNDVKLHINTLGTAAARKKYREVLVQYLQQHAEQLDADSQRRLHMNPLRILDSKNPQMQELINQAPKILDFLEPQSQQHFERIQELLIELNIPFQINSRLVRGLDYYTDTVFEWVTEALGAQGTIAAGGRYDNLVASLGGQPTAAVGYALGCERLIELIKQKNDIAIQQQTRNADIFIIPLVDTAKSAALLLAEKLRSQHELIVLVDWEPGSVKTHFKRADKSGAQLALILGENEIAQNKVSVKHLRREAEQLTFKQEELDYDKIKKLLE